MYTSTKKHLDGFFELLGVLGLGHGDSLADRLLFVLPLTGKGELLELEERKVSRLGMDPDPCEVVEPCYR